MRKITCNYFSFNHPVTFTQLSKFKKKFPITGVFLLQGGCNKCILQFVSRFTQTLSLLCTALVGALSLSSVSPDLHSSLFHGDSDCSHTCTKIPCEPEEKDDKGEEVKSCAVVLFGEGFVPLSHLQVSLITRRISDAKISSVQLIWKSHKQGSSGARDPPTVA